MSSYPQVLLLGNGLNLSYGGVSWSALMKKINVRSDFDPEKMSSATPMPLQAILLSNNNIKDAMKRESQSFFGSVTDSEQKQVLQELLSASFDDILTTNYSYELETAALGVPSVTEYKLKQLCKSSQGKAEPKYLLHTYNEVLCNGITNRIWHIHGEARKPDSMILGHYWYGGLLGRIKEELDKGGNQYYHKQTHEELIAYDSWLDSFILGDIYVLGYGYDLSEFDLWWLLNRKYREKAEKGRFIFYEMQNPEKREKVELLKLFGADVRDFGMTEPCRDDPQLTEKYKRFYSAAIEDIRSEVKSRKGE